MSAEVLKVPEMVRRLGAVLDPEAFLFDTGRTTLMLEPLVTELAAPLIFLGRQQAAYIKARAIIVALREPTELMRERGETRWRELVDLLIDGELAE